LTNCLNYIIIRVSRETVFLIGPVEAAKQKSEVTMLEHEQKTVSVLINAIFYFLENVYIVKSPGPLGYRLIAIHRGRVLADERYETARGARIAFARMFKHKSWKEDVHPQWTHFYDADNAWFTKKGRSAAFESQSPNLPHPPEDRIGQMQLT